MRNLKCLALLAGAYGALSGYPASTLAYEQASTPKTDLSRADISRCVARSLGLMQRSRIPPPLTSFSFKGFFGMDPVD